MKNLTWIVCLLLGMYLAPCAYAQNVFTFPIDKSAAAEASLNGVWQLCYPQKITENSVQLVKLPYIKHLANDETFKTLFVGEPAKIGVLITTQGTFKQQSDSMYVERIQQSATDPVLVGKENPLKFKMLSKNMMVVSYQLPNRSQPGTEIWIRVVVPTRQDQKEPNQSI